MSFQPGAEFAEVVDGLESVILRSWNGRRETRIPHAKRQLIRFREGEPSNGKYRQGDVEWRFSTKELTVAPRLGDRIIASDGENWTVLEVSLAVAGTRWVCVCRNLVITEGLHDHVTIQRADKWEKGASGDAQPCWADYLHNTPARIQPIANIPGQVTGQLTGIETHIIYLAERIEVLNPAEFRVIGSREEIFCVLAHEDAERIDALAKLRTRRMV